MKRVDTEETVVLVTGSSATSEERDRPLAYHLKAEIDRRGAGHAYRRAIVVGDLWYLDNPIFQLNPTLAIGGPGANGVAQEFSAVLPTVYNHEEKVFLQGGFGWGPSSRGPADPPGPGRSAPTSLRPQSCAAHPRPRAAGSRGGPGHGC